MGSLKRMVFLILAAAVILAPDPGTNGLWDINAVEWITLVVVLGSVGWSAAAWGYGRWRAARPFHFRLADWSRQGFDDPPTQRTPTRRSLRSTTLESDGVFLARIDTKDGQKMYFSIRFESRRFALTTKSPFLWRWEPLPESPRVALIQDFSREDSRHWSASHNLNLSETPPLRQGVLTPSTASDALESCWTPVWFKAERPFAGHIALYGRLRHEQAVEHVVRRRIRIGRIPLM